VIPVLRGALSLEGRAVQRVDGYYLYQVGSQIHPLSDIKWQNGSTGKATTLEEARFLIYVAEVALEPLLTRSVFQLKTSLQSGSIICNKTAKR
jgi:hypothetical protein